jgi:hypothetical protein
MTMTRWLLIALMSAGIVRDVAADTPSTEALRACQIPDNHIVGSRTRNRPLPLQAGDAAHGFHPACTVAWSRLSPNNQSLPVVGCFQDSLLQLDNDAACGRGTGRLWVSSRWVVTSADLQRMRDHDGATCERLDNAAVAATRDWLPECVPQNGVQPASAPRAGASAPVSTPAAPAGPAPATHTARTLATPPTSPMATTPATTSEHD